jgi:hypothetical protein
MQYVECEPAGSGEPPVGSGAKPLVRDQRRSPEGEQQN